MARRRRAPNRSWRRSNRCWHVIRSHPGANHYYVHTLEASPHPEKALASAERLRTLMPAAGHLVHMPAHIMQRVGRYEDAAEANRRGAAADSAYIGLTQPLDYYPVMYSAHNYQFLAASAAMEGRRAEAIAAADSSRRVVSDQMLITMPGADWYVAELYTARAALRPLGRDALDGGARSRSSRD